jgi:hypothetical protein
LIRADLDARGIDQLGRGDDVVEDAENPRCINGHEYRQGVAALALTCGLERFLW